MLLVELDYLHQLHGITRFVAGHLIKPAAMTGVERRFEEGKKILKHLYGTLLIQLILILFLLFKIAKLCICEILLMEKGAKSVISG